MRPAVFALYVEHRVYFKLTLEGQASITSSILHLSGSSCRLFCRYHHVKGTGLPSVCSPNILWIPPKDRSIFYLQFFGCTKASKCTLVAVQQSCATKHRKDHPLGVRGGEQTPGTIIRLPGCYSRWEHLHIRNTCWGLRSVQAPLTTSCLKAVSTVALCRYATQNAACLHKGVL